MACEVEARSLLQATLVSGRIKLWIQGGEAALDESICKKPYYILESWKVVGEVKKNNCELLDGHS